jgi:hypothetical protein
MVVGGAKLQGSLSPHRWQIWLRFDRDTGMWFATCPSLPEVEEVEEADKSAAISKVMSAGCRWFVEKYNEGSPVLMVLEDDLPEPPEGVEVRKLATG